MRINLPHLQTDTYFLLPTLCTFSIPPKPAPLSVNPINFSPRCPPCIHARGRRGCCLRFFSEPTACPPPAQAQKNKRETVEKIIWRTPLDDAIGLRINADWEGRVIDQMLWAFRPTTTKDGLHMMPALCHRRLDGNVERGRGTVGSSEASDDF